MTGPNEIFYLCYYKYFPTNLNRQFSNPYISATGSTATVLFYSILVNIVITEKRGILYKHLTKEFRIAKLVHGKMAAATGNTDNVSVALFTYYLNYRKNLISFV
jgi:hypothetical protein